MEWSSTSWRRKVFHRFFGVWKKQVASDETYRKFGEVREYAVYDHELRMETYLNFLSQISASGVDSSGVPDILCITAGRKPLIAAVMCHMHPMAVLVYDKPSGVEYLHAHKLGCKLQNFEHLFDSSIRTEDDVNSDDWRLPAPADASESEDDSVQQEICMKRQGDRRESMFYGAEELQEDSGNSTELSEEGESSEEDVPELQHTEIVEAVAGGRSICPPLSSPITSSSAANFSLVITSPAAQLYKKSSFSLFSPDLEQLLRSKKDMTEPSSSILGESDLGVPATSSKHPPQCMQVLEVDFSTPPVVNCPPEPEVTVRAEPIVVEVEEHLGDMVVAHLDNAAADKIDGPLIQQQVVPKWEPVDVTLNPQPLESNKDDPIIIDSDEDDHILSSVRNDIPSDGESDLSDMPVELGGDSTKAKVSQQRALRIQLKTISKKKLSVNRANIRKNWELEFENRKLLQELAKERELREKERELREEANEKLRSCCLANVLPKSDYPSPFVGRSHQATTSIASAPERSFSELGAGIQVPAHSMQDVGGDCIPGTQESTLERQHVNAIENANVLKGLKASADNHEFKTKQIFQSVEEKLKRARRNNYLFISDLESVSPKYSVCTKLPKNRLVQKSRLLEDDDEVTSILRET